MDGKLKVKLVQEAEMSEQEILDAFGIDHIDIVPTNFSPKIAGRANIYYKYNPVPIQVPLFVRTRGDDAQISPPIRQNAVASPVNQGREIKLNSGRTMVVDQVFVPNAVLELVKVKANETIKLSDEAIEAAKASSNNLASNSNNVAPKSPDAPPAPLDDEPI